MEPKRDYYEVLGVDPDADEKTIKRAFLNLARTLHPDVNKEPGAEEKFKEVNEAYSVLSDERKRANYDRYGDPEGPGGFGSDYVDISDIFGGGFGDIFDSFFGGGVSGGGRSTRTRGRDMGARVRITLEEAAAGCKKTLAYDRLAPCEDCHGTGVAEGGHMKTCDRCHGSGRVVEVQRTIFGQMQSQSTCPDCNGSGKVVDHPCGTCQGQGRCPSHETVEVKIPAGVYSGQTITMDGMGEAGMHGDTGGNLVVSIEVVENERFERQGDDLFCTVQVDSLQAIVGTTVTIEGIMDGEKVTVKVPAGCQYGQQITVEGHGMPRMGMIARGNLIAQVRVETPRDLSNKHILEIANIVHERGFAEGASAVADKVKGSSSGAKGAGKTDEGSHDEKRRSPKNPFGGKGKRK